MKLYKGKYLIAFYDKSDTCRYVFDNTKEVSIAAKINIRRASNRVSKLVKGTDKYTYIFGEPMAIHLIEYKEVKDGTESN